MKKSLFMLGLAVAAMTSCSNDELMEVNTNNVITFESHVNKGTRAVTNTTTDDLTKFYVFGSYSTTNVFENVPVTKGGSGWTYDNPVPWTANNYKFAAYATTNTSIELAPTYAPVDGSLTFTGVTANDASDMVAAVATVDNTTLANNAVALSFKHLLSKVKFTLTNGASQAYTMKVTNITFNAYTTGNCKFNGTATWSDQSASDDIVFTKKVGQSDEIAQGAVFESEDHIVIPGQGLGTIAASFTATFWNGSKLIDTKEYTSVPLALTSGTWQPGYVYNYTATVTPKEPTIQFTVTVEDWKPETVNKTL